MVYPQSSPKENPSTEEKNPLRNSIGKEQPPSIIENRSLKQMIYIRKESPNPQENSYPKHQENALTVVREVISGRCENRRSKLLSTL